jgi:nitrogen fixation-related uncharacterized protein
VNLVPIGKIIVPAALAAIFVWLLVQGLRSGEAFLRITWRRDSNPWFYWLAIATYGVMIPVMIVLLGIGLRELFWSVPPAN